MKYLFVLLSTCLTLGAFTGCDKESDFEKDYKVYRESLTKKKEILQNLLYKHRNEPYYRIYVNNEFITAEESVRIENDMIYIDNNYFFSITEFYGYEEETERICALYFWR